jgi:cytochrome c oxidase cbb3-type subunit II
MKNGPLFLLGLFSAFAISFCAIVLGSHAQIGKLTPYFDETEGQTYPLRAPGLAARGQLVYADLGCAACHTQQVRRPDFGSDKARGWGDRQSVARDYIFQLRPQLGTSRVGPDLANYGARAKKAGGDDAAAGIYRLLYNGSAAHPAYKFLFEEREIAGEASPLAIKPEGQTVGAGREIVPTERAQTLVSYLLSSQASYDYPEAKPFVPPAPAGAASAVRDEKPVPAAAPDEKKKEGEKK